MLFLLLFSVFLFVKPAPILFFALFFGFLHPNFHQTEFILPIFEGEKITVTAVVVEEDRPVAEIKGKDERFYLNLDGSPKFGTLVKVTGKPVSFPKEMKKSMHNDIISASFFDPEVELIGEMKSFRGSLFSIRRTLSQRIDKGMTYPESSILKAVLLGDRTDIPDLLREKFSLVGVAHLLAVSGTHIVIVSGILMGLAHLLKIKMKSIFSISLLFIFILLVGAPPSAIRAGIMGFLFILAEMFGRKSVSIRSLVLVAFFMLLINPSLINNIGFRLSFSAAAGIIIFSKRIKKFLTEYDPYAHRKIKKRISSLFLNLPEFIPDTLAVTLSAQIFVLPLIWIYFENIPFLSPFSNLFIAPLLPVVMIFGGVGLFLFSVFGWVAFLPAQLTSSLIIFFVEIFYSACFLC